MTKVIRIFTVLTIAIIISLIASSFMTVGVVADESTPPLPSEEQPSVEAEEIPPTDENLGEILEQLPEDTNVVLTTEQGIEPLATNLAANLVLIGDPIWCPDGVAPIEGVGGCSISYGSLSELVYNIPEPNADGTIWITAGPDLSPAFVSIDGSVFTNWFDNNLTIQGGWNGDSMGTINSSTSLSTPIEIINWSGNVTINDIIANSVGSTALSIDTGGDINLNNLTANNNNFSGISANSGGNITAQNITANDNGTIGPSYGYGAEFSGTELTLTGTNEFSGNGETGIYATFTGNVSINNMTASGNGTSGIYSSGAEIASTSGGVTLTGANQFNGNNNSGLIIEADGAINAENITANNNGVGTADANGAELISNSDGVTLTGINQFDNNNDVGLYIEANSAINAENITADNNGSTGAEIISSTSGANLSGMNQFNNNYGSGLYIDVNGTIDAENITATGNGTSTIYGGGAEFFGSSLNITGTNQFNNNAESGLYAEIAGNITLANIVATGNGTNSTYGVGAELISTGFIELTGTNVFSLNYSGGASIEAPTNIYILNAEVEDNLDTGLYLSSSGVITLGCSTVIGNNGYGVDANTSSLLLYGTEIDQNTDDDIVSAQNVSYVSNSCFTYPVKLPPEQTTPVEPPLVNSVRVDSGEITELICGTYSSTIIFLPNGDGVVLPCGIGDNARLIEMNSDLIPGNLPRDNEFVSSFDLIVVKDGQPLPPIGEEGSLWYWEIEYDAASDRDILQAYVWDGIGWKNAGLDNLPFISIFFLVPKELKESNLAILFWNGSSWVELADELNLEQGRFVTEGGRFDGTYFKAEVNFIGTFVLVEK